MSLLGSVTKVASAVGSAAALADTLFQNQIVIRDKNNTDNQVVLNVTDSEDLTLTVEITEKPVANLGGAIDYISRTSTPLVLTGQISNRSLDLGKDPAEFLAQQAGKFAPEIVGAVNAGVSLASNFFDLGADEIDKKLQTLNKWQNNATFVEIVGLRLDMAKINNLESFNFLIQEIKGVSDLQNGDNVGITIVFKNLLGIQNPTAGTKKGSKLQELGLAALNLATGRSSPF